MCEYNKDPCTFFQADGNAPVAYNDCDGNPCATFDRCEAVWTDVQNNGYDGTTYGGWDIVDYSGTMCPWAEMNSYTYKTGIPTTISTIDNACKTYISH